MCESEAFLSLSVYTDNPAHLDELQQQVEPLVDDTVRISSSDSLYRQMQAPLKQVTGITTLMLGIVLVTAVIVIFLMLCIWMRTRAKEIAVLIKSKYPVAEYNGKLFCFLSFRNRCDHNQQPDFKSAYGIPVYFCLNFSPCTIAVEERSRAVSLGRLLNLLRCHIL